MSSAVSARENGALYQKEVNPFKRFFRVRFSDGQPFDRHYTALPNAELPHQGRKEGCRSGCAESRELLKRAGEMIVVAGR
jgi:hypothetical protein